MTALSTTEEVPSTPHHIDSFAAQSLQRGQTVSERPEHVAQSPLSLLARPRNCAGLRLHVEANSKDDCGDHEHANDPGNGVQQHVLSARHFCEPKLFRC
eukprot:5463493-Pyramimonas_sp.AAC.1